MDGDAVEVFLTAEQEQQYELTPEHVASKESLKDLFSNSPIVDVEFNQRGRVASVTV